MRQPTGISLALALAVVLLDLPSARANEGFPLPPETDRWIQLRTAHFVFYSNAPERRTLDLGRRLERFRAILSRFNKTFAIDPPVTTSIYVFKDDASLTPYKARFNGRPIEMAGLFVGHPDGYYIEVNGGRQDDPLETIYHEYTHHFLENNLHNVPAWFNEGLAECYGTFRADDRKASIGLTQDDHLGFLQQHDLLPLHDLFAITNRSADYNEGERRGVFYAESWALVHYLTWDKPERRPQYIAFLERLSRGEDPDTAFPASFGVPYKTLEFELQNHVRQARFLFTVYPIKELGIDDAVKVDPMKREEVLDRLGDLMAHLDADRAPDAATLFREALRLSPSFAAPQAGLAYLACQAGRYDEAIDLYDKATALDPQNPMTTFHEGQCLTRRSTASAGDLARGLEMFGRTIQLRPGFAESYVAYANTLIETNGNPASAIHLLLAAQKMLPSRIDVIENLAVLYAVKGDDAKARDIVDNALQRMNDREAVQRTRERVRMIEGSRVAPSLAIGPASGEAENAPGAAGAPGSDDPPPLPELHRPETGGVIETLAARQRHVASINRAVERANKGDLKGAIGDLESLQAEVKAADLRDQIATLLEKMRKDLARLQKSHG
jgi:tetratricopeptide (TPR) repeat protein